MPNEIKRIVDTTEAEHYTWGQNCDGWHFLKAANLSVIRESMPKGTKEKLHYHQKSQQFFYILSGEASFEINGTTHIVKQDQGISIGPGEKHKVRNNSDKDLQFILISSPMAQGDRIDLE